MAKALANVLQFPKAAIIQFPTKLCGCGCGILLNEQEDSFIKSDEYQQWYVDEIDMMNALDVVKANGKYRWRGTDYWYTKQDFYQEIRAYWVNEYAPIA